MRFNRNRTYDPGPTSYNTNTSWLTIGPKISWNKAKRKELFLKRDNIPGPGSYDHNKCSYKILGASSPKEIDKRTAYTNKITPGPSDYSILHLNKLKTKSPKAVFGKERRNTSRTISNTRLNE